MTRIEEGYLVFEFGDKWRVFKFDDDNLLPYAKFLCNQKKDIRVILWLEQDFPKHIFNEQRTIKSVNRNTLKQKLKWLTSKVLVCSINSNKQCLPDVKVSNLPIKSTSRYKNN